MKKKWLTTVVTALCLALVASLFTACGKKQVKIELSQTTLELIVGEGATLVATTSNGKDVEWSTSDAKVATVSSRGGVTAQGAGTCTITAKYGKATATCAVTVKEKIVVSFTFTDGSGATLTEATVDRDGTLQLNATASDDSEITSWESQDESIATVSPTGLVRGLFDGDTNIVVKTATGQGTIKVTVVDKETDKYAITTEKKEGKWWYAISTDGGRTHELTRSEYRKGVVRFAFTGNCNYAPGDVKLGFNDPTVTEGWHTVTGKINADFDNKAVTINGTAVMLHEGDNTFKIAYNQLAAQDSLVIAFEGKGGYVNDSCSVVISDLVWSDFTPVTLKTPTFTLADGNITITTSDTEGIDVYQVGLFETETSKRPLFTQNFDAASGKLDTSSCKKNGEFIVKVRTIGNVGYSSSAWSDGNDVKWTVDNDIISYDVAYGGEADAKKTENVNKWMYWAGDGSAVESVKYHDGTVTVKTKQIGWAFYGIQLFYQDSSFEVGENVKITMTVKASHAGSITVRGNAFKLEANQATTIDIYTSQVEGNTSTIGIQLGVSNGGEDYPPFAPGEDELTVEFSDIQFDNFDPIKLAGATIAVDGNNAFTITDDGNAGKTVDGYKIEIFNGENEVVKTQTVKDKTGDLDVAAIGAGSFTAKVTTLGHGMYVSSDASAACDAFTVTTLIAPSIAVTEGEDGGYTYTITDTNDAAYVKGYEIYVGSSKFSVTEKTGTLDVSAIATGEYKVKVKALASKKFANAESAEITVNISNDDPSYEITECANEETYLASDKVGQWVRWNQTPNTITGTAGKDSLTVELTANSGEFWVNQLFYKSAEVGNCTITMNITSTVTGNLTVNGQKVELTAGVAKSITVSQAGASTISIQMGVNGEPNTLSNCTVTFADIVITAA